MHQRPPFLEDGRVCLSNNAAERSLRGAALGRKAWLFAGSERGGERAAFMYTLIVTAKLNDVDPQAWLADVLARIAGTPMTRLHESSSHGAGRPSIRRSRPRSRGPRRMDTLSSSMMSSFGFCKALEKAFPSTRHQRCWVHKVSNILNTLPKSSAPQVKTDLGSGHESAPDCPVRANIIGTHATRSEGLVRSGRRSP